MSRNEMYDELAVFLGGRVAEEIFCGDITTGASNDLERATKMARQMVVNYGMSDALGQQTFGQPNHEVFLGRDYADHQDYSEETARRIDIEVQRIMREAHRRAVEILDARRDQLDLMGCRNQSTVRRVKLCSTTRGPSSRRRKLLVKFLPTRVSRSWSLSASRRSRSSLRSSRQLSRRAIPRSSSRLFAARGDCGA